MPEKSTNHRVTITFTRPRAGIKWRVNVSACSRFGITTSGTKGRWDDLYKGPLARLVDALINRCDETFEKSQAEINNNNEPGKGTRT